MPRLFTGLEVPAKIADRLALLRGGLPGARWIDVENYHITLRFLGDVDERTAREASLALGNGHREPIPVTIDALDAFGGVRPRSLIAKVEPGAELLDLQAEQERVLRRVGLPAESRKYTPHVTLARLRDTSPRAVADWRAMRGGMARMTFEASRFVLFSSRDSTGGGPYLVEQTYPFGFEMDEDEHDDEDGLAW
ncbi:RNA 2',3'-cyclic phosphodiesterase [Terrihabitans sp. B22-R8]|uniref:RNA 2',3'-cyclic phosphodiesterase n=1 Tax=Terrihabitans sp. B22-R8 TaxID=3425128 RepID=UPI00403C6FC6